MSLANKGGKMSLLINIFGAPKSGKTTMMASITTFLKLRGAKCEMAPDFPKEVLYEERFSLLQRQLYILAVQEKRIYDLYKFSDVVVTDCPILHSVVYNHDQCKTLHPYIKELHESYNNLNIMMRRTVKPNYGCFKIFTPAQLDAIEENIYATIKPYKHYVFDQKPESLSEVQNLIIKEMDVL